MFSVPDACLLTCNARKTAIFGDLSTKKKGTLFRDFIVLYHDEFKNRGPHALVGWRAGAVQ